MPDIGIYCRKEVLEHKKRDGKGLQGRECYWEFAQIPNISKGERFWFASEGRWQGFFIVKEIFTPEFDLTFDSESWHSLGADGGPRKPFQGFTYNVPPKSWRGKGEQVKTDEK